MQDLYVNSNEGMFLDLINSVGQGGKQEPLESPHRLELIVSKLSI